MNRPRILFAFLGLAVAPVLLVLACGDDTKEQTIAPVLSFPDEAGIAVDAVTDDTGIPILFTGGGNVRFVVSVSDPALVGTAHATVEALTPATGDAAPPSTLLLLTPQPNDGGFAGSGTIAWPQRGPLQLRVSVLGAILEQSVRVLDPTLTARLTRSGTSNGAPKYLLCVESATMKDGVVNIALSGATTPAGASSIAVTLGKDRCSSHAEAGPDITSAAETTVISSSATVGVTLTVANTDVVVRDSLAAGSSNLVLEYLDAGPLAAEGGIMPVRVRAMLDGKPVGGVKLSFQSIPAEAFLPATGSTDSNGGFGTQFIVGPEPAVHIEAITDNASVGADLRR